MNAHYFDTTRLPAPDLAQATTAAKGQEAAVMAVFHRAGRPMSPWEVLEASGLKCPPTSIRRAITVLTTAGALVKLDTLVPGPWGKPSHLWQLAPGQMPLFPLRSVK